MACWVSLALSAVLSGLSSRLCFDAAGGLAQAINIRPTIGVPTELFAAIYRVFPDVQRAWRDVSTGAVMTALLFAIGKQRIGLSAVPPPRPSAGRPY